MDRGEFPGGRKIVELSAEGFSPASVPFAPAAADAGNTTLVNPVGDVVKVFPDGTAYRIDQEKWRQIAAKIA